MVCPGVRGFQIGRVFRVSGPTFFLAALLPAACAAAAETPPSPEAASATAPPDAQYARVTVAPCKTSIYIGTVSLAVPPLARRDGTYASEYRARVFPFFFFSEHGSLAIDLPDEDLHRLLHGEIVQFKGHAVSSAGEGRRIEGRAVPDGPGADHGRIKIRVWAGKVELIFNSVYRFSRTG